jgi:hypothetical protein
LFSYFPPVFCWCTAYCHHAIFPLLL